MRTVQGIPASTGVARGPWVVIGASEVPAGGRITPGQAEAELERLVVARDAAAAELEALAAELTSAGRDEGEIFDAQAMMARDPVAAGRGDDGDRRGPRRDRRDPDRRGGRGRPASRARRRAPGRSRGGRPRRRGADCRAPGRRGSDGGPRRPLDRRGRGHPAIDRRQPAARPAARHGTAVGVGDVARRDPGACIRDPGRGRRGRAAGCRPVDGRRGRCRGRRRRRQRRGGVRARRGDRERASKVVAQPPTRPPAGRSRRRRCRR